MGRYTMEDVGRIGAAIAESMYNPVRWIETLDQLCESIGNVRAIFNPVYPSAQSYGLAMPSSNWDPAPPFDLFPQHIYRGDVHCWLLRKQFPERGGVVALEGSEGWVRNSEMHALWLKPLGLAADPGLICSFGMNANMPTGGLGIYREAGRAQFDQEDVAFIKALTPILLTASRLHGFPGLMSAEANEVREGPPEIGVATLDAKRRLVSCNAALQSMIASGRLRVMDGALAMDTRPATFLLTWAIQEALFRRPVPNQAELFTVAGPIVLHGTTCRLNILALPLEPKSAMGLPCSGKRAQAVLLTRDLAVPTPSLESTLVEVFGLTPVQAQVAWLRASGLSEKDIARRTQQTGRNHIERIHSKLGVRGAAALTHRVLSIASFVSAQSGHGSHAVAHEPIIATG